MVYPDFELRPYQPVQANIQLVKLNGQGCGISRTFEHMHGHRSPTMLARQPEMTGVLLV